MKKPLMENFIFCAVIVVSVYNQVETYKTHNENNNKLKFSFISIHPHNFNSSFLLNNRFFGPVT